MKHIFLISIICFSAQLFGAADDTTADIAIHTHGCIDVYKHANSSLQHHVAFDRKEMSSVVVCFAADEKLKKGSADEILKSFSSLHLHDFLADNIADKCINDRLELIRQRINVRPTQLIAVFLIRQVSPDTTVCKVISKTSVQTYGSALRESRFVDASYCQINSEGAFCFQYTAPDNAEGIRTMTSSLEEGDIGFRVRSQMHLLDQKKGCSIL